jgi:hypothetical protein
MKFEVFTMVNAGILISSDVLPVGVLKKETEVSTEALINNYPHTTIYYS